MACVGLINLKFSPFLGSSRFSHSAPWPTGSNPTVRVRLQGSCWELSGVSSEGGDKSAGVQTLALCSHHTTYPVSISPGLQSLLQLLLSSLPPKLLFTLQNPTLSTTAHLTQHGFAVCCPWIIRSPRARTTFCWLDSSSQSQCLALRILKEGEPAPLRDPGASEHAGPAVSPKSVTVNTCLCLLTVLTICL